MPYAFFGAGQVAAIIPLLEIHAVATFWANGSRRHELGAVKCGAVAFQLQNYPITQLLNASPRSPLAVTAITSPPL